MAWFFTSLLAFLLGAWVLLAVRKQWAYVIPITLVIISLGANSFLWRSEPPGAEFVGVRRDIFGESHEVIQGWEQTKLLPWQYISPKRISFGSSRDFPQREARLTVTCYYFQGQAEKMIKEGEQLLDPEECAERTFEIYEQQAPDLRILEAQIRQEYPGMLVWVFLDRVVVI